MAQPGEWTTERVAAALAGPNSRLLRPMSEGVAITAQADEPPGSCVLVVHSPVVHSPVVHSPVVQSLADLPRERRLRFLEDLDKLGVAVHNVCRRRDRGLVGVDLHITSGGDLLHAHVCPRYDGRNGAPDQPEPRYDDLHRELADELDRIEAAGRADYPAKHVYRARSPA